MSSFRPYSGFAGRDASRGLATFSVEPVSISDCFGPSVITINTDLWQVSDEYDDLSDLKPSEMEQVKEWELQFRFLKKIRSPYSVLLTTNHTTENRIDQAIITIGKSVVILMLFF